MRFYLLLSLLSSTMLWAQSSPSASPNSSDAPPPSAKQDSSSSSTPNSTPASKSAHQPNLEPPRSDRVNAGALEEGQSSSKDTQIDLSPPEDDAKSHPKSSDAVLDAEGSPGEGNVGEFHPWDPHKAAKDVEVGDFYFKRKNYKAAEDRYREALYYKDNDAMATYRLAVCLEKMDRLREAQKEYEDYLKILPYGPEADKVKKALERLKATASAAR
jgi:tetratricopeptide (TPR) repeat protein